MYELTRRELLMKTAAAAAALLNPVAKLAAAVKPVKIRDVDMFRIEIPVSKEEADAAVYYRYGVTKVVTDVGVSGYSFAGGAGGRGGQGKSGQGKGGPGAQGSAAEVVKKILVGKDLFAVDEHLKNGLINHGAVEHAVWDAIGRIANQPVYKLLGGGNPTTSAKLYLTAVWLGNADQSDVTYEQQASYAAKLKKAGFLGMKIRAWRPKPLDDAEACREIKAAVGPDFAVMFDRTATAPESVGQKVWDWETGLKVAQALQKHGAYWLEEPFARDDYESPARLCREMDMLITGGEGYRGLEGPTQCMMHKTYDIIQPDGVGCGGLYTARKVAILAEAFGVPTILHGNASLSLAGWLQASLANRAPWQESVFVRPPLLPQEMWAPGLKVLKTKEMYPIRDGYIHAPEFPGLGLDVDEEAVERFRVKT